MRIRLDASLIVPLWRLGMGIAGLAVALAVLLMHHL